MTPFTFAEANIDVNVLGVGDQPPPPFFPGWTPFKVRVGCMPKGPPGDYLLDVGEMSC